MRSRGGTRRREIGFATAGVWLIVLASPCAAHARPPGPVDFMLSPGQREALALGDLKAGQTYTLLVTLESGRLHPDDRLTVELSAAGTDRFVKELHAGDPDSISPIGPHATARAI